MSRSVIWTLHDWLNNSCCLSVLFHDPWRQYIHCIKDGCSPSSDMRPQLQQRKLICTVLETSTVHDKSFERKTTAVFAVLYSLQRVFYNQ